jgi:omega-6 fatty acid desaturase (delta-12 desaturase)
MGRPAKFSFFLRRRTEMSTPQANVPSRRELIHDVNVYAQSNTARGVALFTLDLLLYAGAIAGVLFFPPLWAKTASSIFAGMALGRIFSLAHNAAHENIVRSRRLNRIFATILFLPIFYNCRLWSYEPHALHHPFTNDTKSDAFKPFSKQEFDALPAWRRWLERFYRSPTVISWGIYYLVERHWSTKIYPPPYLPARLRPAAWLNTALLGIYAAGLLSILAAAPYYAVNLGTVGALLLGFALPLFVFEIHDGFALYVQHTDPRIPWFNTAVDRNAEGRTELLSVHLVVPRLMGIFYHDVFAHPVHHLHPKVPCYHAYKAQKLLDSRLGPAAVVRYFGLTWALETSRTCKLYDWDNHQWLSFDGKPTTQRLVVSQYAGRGDARRADSQTRMAGKRSQVDRATATGAMDEQRPARA